MVLLKLVLTYTFPCLLKINELHGVFEAMETIKQIKEFTRTEEERAKLHQKLHTELRHWRRRKIVLRATHDNENKRLCFTPQTSSPVQHLSIRH